jgi:hypothetical protein
MGLCRSRTQRCCPCNGQDSWAKNSW